MIRMDISTAIFLYIMSSLLVLFWLWVFYERKNVMPKFLREEADVWECGICFYIYVDSTHHEISQCPQCKSYNKKTPEERII